MSEERANYMPSVHWNKIKATVSVQHHNFLVAEVERLRAEIEQLKTEFDQKEAERLDACDRRNIAYAVVEDLQDEMRQLISACDTVMIFCETAAKKVIDEEYQRLVIEPFKEALALAKGESPVIYKQKPVEEWIEPGRGES